VSLRQRTCQNLVVLPPSLGQLTTYDTWERRYLQLESEMSTDMRGAQALQAILFEGSVLMSWESEELPPVNDYTRVSESLDRSALKRVGSGYSCV
jgi:hypothetical protein